MTDGPVFLLGAPRSGTTLLRLLLNAHPRLCLPHECSLVAEFLKAFPDENAPLSPSAFYEKAAGVGRFEEVFGLSHDEFAKDLSETETVGTCLATLYARSMGNEHANPIWGDKTIGYTVLAERLATFFPGSRFIYLIRNPLDVAASCSKNFGSRYGVPGGKVYDFASYVGGALIWRDFAEATQAFSLRDNPERYLEVHYEDLAREPETACRQLCAFLDIEDETQTMLGFFREDTHRNLPKDSRQFHGETMKPVDPGRIGKAKDNIPADLQSALLDICRAPMKAWDMPSESVGWLTRKQVLISYHCGHHWRRISRRLFKRS